MKRAFIRLCIKLLGILAYKRKQIEVLHLKMQQGVDIHDSFYVQSGTFFNINGTIKQLSIAKNVMARRYCNFLMYPGAALVIHENVFFNNYCAVNCLGLVEIGENTLFGEGVKIYDHNHTYDYSETGMLRIARDDFKIGSVRIGKNYWVGSNVTILNNVTIGDNVIIGANCLIYKNVPANSIVRSTGGTAVQERVPEK